MTDNVPPLAPGAQRETHAMRSHIVQHQCSSTRFILLVDGHVECTHCGSTVKHLRWVETAE